MNSYLEKTSRFEFKTDASNGCLVGPKGCHYDSEAEAMYYDQLGMCGCGTPNAVHAFVIKILRDCRHSDYPSIVSADKIKKVLKEHSDEAFQFIAHVLTNCELMEHGGSVYASWLTDRGKQFVEIGAMEEDD